MTDSADLGSKGNPLLDPSSPWFWVDNSLYLLASAYCMIEWLRLVYYDKGVFGVQVLIVFLSAVWAFLEGASGLLYDQIRDSVVGCFPKSLLYFVISSFVPIFIYSLLLLFFIECYVFIKAKTDRYCSHLCVMSLVFLFFLVDKSVSCQTGPDVDVADPVEDFNIAVSVMRLVFFLAFSVPDLTCPAAGIVVFFLVRGLNTTILAAKHDLVRARFKQVLFIYLPTFLGKFALLLLHLIDPTYSLNAWEIFVWIIIVDILPTIAVVFSFRAKATVSGLADHTIVTYYHKDENESWDNFAINSSHMHHQPMPPYEGIIEDYEAAIEPDHVSQTP